MFDPDLTLVHLQTYTNFLFSFLFFFFFLISPNHTTHKYQQRSTMFAQVLKRGVSHGHRALLTEGVGRNAVGYSPLLISKMLYHPQINRFKRSANPENEGIRSLVPETGVIQLIDINRKFQSNVSLVDVLKNLKEGEKLVVANKGKQPLDEEGNPAGDPAVTCKIIRSEVRQKPKKAARQAANVQELENAEPEASHANESAPPLELLDKESIRKENKRRAELNAQKKAEARAKRKAGKELNKKSGPAKVKSVSLSWTIGPHDLHSQKKSSIESWLSKGHTVQIVLGRDTWKNRNMNSPLELEKKNVLIKACRELCEEAGGIEQGMEGDISTSIILTFAPSSN